MVSARPPPSPAQGRVAYPSAANYTSGDYDASPDYLDAHGSPSAPITKVKSSDSDGERGQGLKTWWKGFRERSGSASGAAALGSGGQTRRICMCFLRPLPNPSGRSRPLHGHGEDGRMAGADYIADRGVFGVPLQESIQYAAVQISTAGQDGSLYVWG